MPRIQSITLSCFLTIAAYGQSKPVPPRWLYGGRIGATTSHLLYLGRKSSWKPGPTAAVSGGYLFSKAHLAVVADVVYQQQALITPARKSYVAVPVFLRTGAASERLHLLLGGGFSYLLKVPRQDVYASYNRRKSFVGVGLEHDLRIQAKYNLLLSTFLQYDLTPSMSEYHYSPSGHYYPTNKPSNILLGIALTSYWYR